MYDNVSGVCRSQTAQVNAQVVDALDLDGATVLLAIGRMNKGMSEVAVVHSGVDCAVHWPYQSDQVKLPRSWLYFSQPDVGTLEQGRKRIGRASGPSATSIKSTVPSVL